MIFIDTETTIDGIKKSPKLFPLSGANALISSVVVPPATEQLLEKHVAAGAIFFRTVTEPELKNMEEGQLLINLKSLIKLGCKPWQCILLIESSHERQPIETYIDKVDLWVDCGGSSVDTAGNPYIHYLKNREKTFLKRAKERELHIYPAYGARHEVDAITDWRRTLMTFPGIGARGAVIVREMMLKEDYGDNLLDAILFITSLERLKKAEGPMKTIMESARKFLALPDGFDISVDIPELKE